MGSSAKRKKEKKKDFQKPKLKVGKTRPKNSNFTDTSFKAKSIVIHQQSISATAPTAASQFVHHLSMLTSRSESQRKESLAYLTSNVTSRPHALPQPVAVVIPKIQPLIVDGSNGVRHQLMRLLQSLPAGDVAGHVDQLLLYTRAGMTHLAPEIRSSSLGILTWLLEVAGEEVVTCAGGWAKTLKCFIGVIGWQSDIAGNWSSKMDLSRGGNDSNLFAKQIHALSSFLRTGLASKAGDPHIHPSNSFPLWQTQQHLLPKQSSAFRHLNLFGAPRDEESEMYEDREDRQRYFSSHVHAAVQKGTENALKEAGEVGRAAAALKKTVTEGLSDFEPDDVEINDDARHKGG